MSALRGDVRGFGQTPEVIGAETAAFMPNGGAAASSPARAIFIGVSTGVLVWTVTRILDRVFGLSRRVA